MTVTDAAPREGTADQAWWRGPFRLYQTNLREIDAGMDVDAVLDVIEDYGANAWLLNGGGILAFHPSDLDFQTRNPYLVERASGDLVGDALAASRRRGVRVFARMDFSKVASRIAAEHPDWLFIGPEGSKQVYNGLVSVCPSAGYYQSAAFEVLTEFATRYPVDGFFFNWFSFNEVDYSRVYRGVCHCAACVRGFAEFAPGVELPNRRGDAAYDRWHAFAAAVMNDLTSRFRSHIHDLLPDAALILGRSADIMFHESNTALGRELWPHATSEAVSLSKSVRPEVPVLVNPAVFVDMPYRYAPIEPQHFAHYTVQAIARGALPSAYTMGTPFATPYPNMELGRQVMHAHREHEDVYAALRPVADVLLVSQPIPMQDPGREEYRGLHEALQRAHIPFDIAPVHGLVDVLEGRDIRYRVVVMPDLGIDVDDETVAALDRFVVAGGTVVTTGGALFRESTPQLAASPAIRRSAAAVDAEDLRNSYIASDEPGYADGYRRLVPVAGSYHYVDLHPDATGHLRYLAQAPYGPPERCYGTTPVDYPGWAERASGAGRVVLVPWAVGTTARAFGTGSINAWFAEIVGRMLPPRRRVEARNLPESVEIIVGQSGGRLVIHLLNFSGVRHNGIGPEIAVRGAELLVRGAASARSLVSGQRLTALRDDGTLLVPVPDIGLYEALVLEPDEP